jgi:hypothetical protein
MMVDTRIYGYVDDGSVVCTRCWQPADAIEELHAGPLFSHDDDGNGLSCDDCGEYVFEPTLSNVWTLDGLSTSYDVTPDQDSVDVYGTRADGTELDTQATLRWVDSDYGTAFGAFVGDDLDPVAIFATPDHPSMIAGVEVTP